MMNLAILGSSGSIGKNALWVAERFPEEFSVFALSVYSDIAALAEQVSRYKPKIVCIANPDTAVNLDADLGDSELVIGEKGLEKIASLPEIDIVVNALVGFAGLRSTIAAANTGKRIALANKESMVAGGDLVNAIAAANNAEIIPVDSEHSAIFQCLKAGRASDIKRLILTSSGGPFRTLPKEEFSKITVERALEHPTWNMGKKITIDSATLMNKGLEIIEAVYLFDLAPEWVDIVIHPQSIVHSMVEYIDGSIIAQMSRPDMRLPIQYALFYPERREMREADLGIDKKFSLDFEPPNEDKFPSLRLAREALIRGETGPAIYNAANEIAVEAFLDGRIGFERIFEIVENTLNNSEILKSDNIESIIKADSNSRKTALKYIGK
ncbi:MAG: 1-deoxy-D-xylulose-5-phosphate reductoisomerase [candidate division Zixibacteria bacterium]